MRKGAIVVSPCLLPRLELDHLFRIEDKVLVRDARGRGPRPSLVGSAGDGGGAPLLEVRGPFTVIQRFSVDPRDGASFARIMRDENPIHIEGEVIPGAMTTARALLIPELLLQNARIERAKLKFRALAYYRRPTVNVFRMEPVGPGTMKIEVVVSQDGQDVADGQLLVSVGGPGMAAGGALCDGPEGASPETLRVRGFLESLRIDPALYFQGVGLVYPRAYLAALPPGEMVRKYSGEGGILNALDLEFPGEALLGVASAPTVELDDSARTRKTFRKIIARIAEGVRTFCSGFAMVLPREAKGNLAGERLKYTP